MSEVVHASLKTAAKGTAFVFAGIAVNQMIWFITRLLIVRNLSKEELGIYSLSFAIVSIVSLLASMGLKEGSTRYISIFSGQGRKEDADAVHRSSLRIVAITGIGTCAVIFLLSGVLSRYVFYKPELDVPLMVIAFFIPAYVMALILASVLRGYGSISPNVYFIEIGQPFLFLVFVCLIFPFGMSFISIIYAYVFSMAAACALIAYYAYRETGIGPFAVTGGHDYVRELLKFSVPVLSIDVVFLLFRWTDTLVLGRYGSAEEVGIYSVGASLAVLLSLPLAALWYVYLPIAGDLYARNRMADLSRTYKVLTKWIFAVTLPMFFILFFFPEMTLVFLFGTRFAVSAAPLRILSFGYLFTAFVGANSMLLLVFGLSKAVMKVSAVCALLNVLLNYVLIKHLGLGIKGASLATTVSLIAVSLGYSFVLYRHSGMHPISSGYLKPVIGSTVIGVAIYAAAKSLPLHFWMLPIYFLLYICGYVASLIFTRSLDAEDVLLFVEVMKRTGVSPELTRNIIGRIYKGNMEKSDVF
jgi:O-antigen/teichoic acid export membrane protein